MDNIEKLTQVAIAINKCERQEASDADMLLVGASIVERADRLTQSAMSGEALLKAGILTDAMMTTYAALVLLPKMPAAQATQERTKIVGILQVANLCALDLANKFYGNEGGHNAQQLAHEMAALKVALSAVKSTTGLISRDPNDPQGPQWC